MIKAESLGELTRDPAKKCKRKKSKCPTCHKPYIKLDPRQRHCKRVSCEMAREQARRQAVYARKKAKGLPTPQGTPIDRSFLRKSFQVTTAMSYLDGWHPYLAFTTSIQGIAGLMIGLWESRVLRAPKGRIVELRNIDDARVFRNDRWKKIPARIAVKGTAGMSILDSSRNRVAHLDAPEGKYEIEVAMEQGMVVAIRLVPWSPR